MKSSPRRVVGTILSWKSLGKGAWAVGHRPMRPWVVGPSDPEPLQSGLVFAWQAPSQAHPGLGPFPGLGLGPAQSWGAQCPGPGAVRAWCAHAGWAQRPGGESAGSTQGLEVESGRTELSQELGPVRVGSLGSAKSGVKPSQESRGRAWAWVWACAWRVCYGDWLRNAWSGCSNWLHYL